MAIATAAQQTPITTPNANLQFTDKDGKLTPNGKLAIQQLHSFVVNMARNMPTNAVTTSGTALTLTPLQVAPLITQYAEGDQYHFVADANSTGNVTANVALPTGTLATINVYKTNGSAQATSGDITAGLQYWLTYVSSLNSGAGGFVIR